MRGLFRSGSAFAAVNRGGRSMKIITIVALTIFALACKVEKTGRDTYKVVAPTMD
jgi:hypothetical protein